MVCGWNEDHLGLNPGLRTPRLPTTHAEADTGHRALTRVLHLRHQSNLNGASHFHSCTLTSHPPVRCFEHHLGVGAGVLELQSKRDRVVDDPYRRELLAGFGLAHDHRPLPMQIDPDELPAVILVHRGLPWFRGSNTPSIRRERHEERRPRPFIASSW